jgi:hypothetical protein
MTAAELDEVEARAKSDCTKANRWRGGCYAGDVACYVTLVTSRGAGKRDHYRTSWYRNGKAVKRATLLTH